MRRTWAVEDRSGCLIGRISLRDIDNGKAQARLGITFGAPYIGRGLGTDALGLFLDHYFTDLGFLVLLLDVAAPNQRAVRAYERLGFSHIGGDWRQADSRFDRHILSDPRYAQIQSLFSADPAWPGCRIFRDAAAQGRVVRAPMAAAGTLGSNSPRGLLTSFSKRVGDQFNRTICRLVPPLGRDMIDSGTDALCAAFTIDHIIGAWNVTDRG